METQRTVENKVIKLSELKRTRHDKRSKHSEGRKTGELSGTRLLRVAQYNVVKNSEAISSEFRDVL